MSDTIGNNGTGVFKTMARNSVDPHHHAGRIVFSQKDIIRTGAHRIIQSIIAQHNRIGFEDACSCRKQPCRTAANAAVIAVEMRRPSAAAFNQSQTDKPGLRGGITPLFNNYIVETDESQYWATGCVIPAL